MVCGLTYLSARRDPPTAREQSPLGDALPVLDATLGEVAAVLDPARTVAVVGGYRRVTPRCRITAVRTGVRYERTLTAYTAVGSEGALLTGVATDLPDRYRARVTPVRKFVADAGSYVALTGAVTAPGRVRFSVDTGCRPGSGTRFEPGTAEAPAAARAAVSTALDAMGAAPSGWTAHRATCPDRSALWTVTATAGTVGAVSPPDGLSPSGTPSGTTPSGTGSSGSGSSGGSSGGPSLAGVAGRARSAAGITVVLERSEALGYREGTTEVLATRVDGVVTVAATTGCDRR